MNNPFLSVLIIVAIALADTEAGLGCAIGGVAATTELFLGLHPWSALENGVAPFNGALVGSVIPSLYPLLYTSDHDIEKWMAVFIGALARWANKCCGSYMYFIAVSSLEVLVIMFLASFMCPTSHFLSTLLQSVHFLFFCLMRTSVTHQHHKTSPSHYPSTATLPQSHGRELGEASSYPWARSMV